MARTNSAATSRAPWSIVGDNLRFGYAVGFDLTIDEERRRCPHWPLRRTAEIDCVGTSIVQDECGGIGGDGSVDQIVLPVRVIVMRVNAYAIPKSYGACGSSVRLCLK